MAITSAICTSAKVGWLSGAYTFNDNYSMALYVLSASLDQTTTVYSSTNEVVGAGYSAGGQALSAISLSASGSYALLSWGNASWPNATITAGGALIYNTSKANAAIATISFGGNIASTNGTFAVNFPTYAQGTAFIQM